MVKECDVKVTQIFPLMEVTQKFRRLVLKLIVHRVGLFFCCHFSCLETFFTSIEHIYDVYELLYVIKITQLQ